MAFREVSHCHLGQLAYSLVLLLCTSVFWGVWVVLINFSYLQCGRLFEVGAKYSKFFLFIRCAPARARAISCMLWHFFLYCVKTPLLLFIIMRLPELVFFLFLFSPFLLFTDASDSAFWIPMYKKDTPCKLKKIFNKFKQNSPTDVHWEQATAVTSFHVRSFQLPSDRSTT